MKQCIPIGYADDYKLVTTDLTNLPVETVVKKSFEQKSNDDVPESRTLRSKLPLCVKPRHHTS